MNRLTPDDLAARVTVFDVDDLTLWEANPNRADTAAIHSSMEEWGQIDTILVATDPNGRRVVIDGNHRVAAERQARRFGGKLAGIDVTGLDWTGVRAFAAGLALNRTARLGADDEGLLAAILTQIRDEDAALLHAMAYTDDDLASLLASDGAFGETGNGATIGEPAPSLADRFIVPPFSVLDARQGYWQERKRRWISIGIQSELGRGESLTDGDDPGGVLDKGLLHRAGPSYVDDRRAVYAARASSNTERLVYARGARSGSDDLGSDVIQIVATGSGTSIFDPVLCELAYRWFVPPSGAVLDPFAGGSVRGVVAALLGHPYTGIDLSAEQVAANVAQWAAIASARREPVGATVDVTVSAANARQEFAGCQPDYIANVCHAACCRSSTDPNGIVVTIHPSEQAAIEARGGVVTGGLLQPRGGEKRCPFQNKGDHLCGLHGTDDKPFGCIASPFTLSPGGRTLIVRNRYRRLKCYKDGARLPAYVAFRSSLDLIFGSETAQQLHDHFEAGGGDITVPMPVESRRRLVDNDDTKHGRVRADEQAPTWIVGDSRDVLAEPADPDTDFVFSCPPYADLERYSDDPADLSTMDYDRFLDAYRDIIRLACARLRPDRFACFVVGDIRRPDGAYRNFVSDTIDAFLDCGLGLYNEAILVTPAGSLPIRSGRQFSAGRKLGKTHQNVLVFVKGSGRAATDACGVVDVALPDEMEQVD